MYKAKNMEKISYCGDHFEKCIYLKLPQDEMYTLYRMLLKGSQGYKICREKLLPTLFVQAKISTLAAGLVVLFSEVRWHHPEFPVQKPHFPFLLFAP